MIVWCYSTKMTEIIFLTVFILHDKKSANPFSRTSGFRNDHARNYAVPLSSQVGLSELEGRRVSNYSKNMICKQLNIEIKVFRTVKSYRVVRCEWIIIYGGLTRFCMNGMWKDVAIFTCQNLHFGKYVGLTVCLSVCLSLHKITDNSRTLWDIPIKISPQMYLGCSSIAMSFQGQRSKVKVTRSPQRSNLEIAVTPLIF